MKKFWRCFICNDLHSGANPPEICPTCKAGNAYVEISSGEAQTITSLQTSPAEAEFNKEKFRKAIEKLAENNEFQVNTDQDKVKMLMDGVFNNEQNHGLKYCPCRLITKDFEEDLKLVCPCNFLIHETYKENGECWCGLFVRRDKP